MPQGEKWFYVIPFLPWWCHIIINLTFSTLLVYKWHHYRIFVSSIKSSLDFNHLHTDTTILLQNLYIFFSLLYRYQRQPWLGQTSKKFPTVRCCSCLSAQLNNLDRPIIIATCFYQASKPLKRIGWISYCAGVQHGEFLVPLQNSKPLKMAGYI